ncbi:ABC transporter ATP-binding protein [Anaerosalibacter sp. Marseille-P3206]|uniref:ABC transporter ATP-binding protein n=1 Tax=Anaerosalibacter sp. Marseille-P3206 TaxID=1871005 RepID=UPI00098629C5|nr:ABC transporter ATP-binding protein [Anaerosalibacter sp. Marseille-P3206]
MEEILTVKNLSVSFNTYAGEVKAVRNISFHLNVGETLVVVGESGCGKTVTSKSIVRLLPEDITNINSEAEIIFDNRDILKMNKKELENLRGGDISMIFQDPMTYLNPTMKIGNQIAESLIFHEHMNKKDALDKTVEMLELVKIPNAKKRVTQYPHEFSGGMRQRVMIAIALACNPKILIADEPTTALDVTTQADIMELIGDLQEELNTSVMIITHDLGIAAEVADRIQVMYAGEIIERGTKKEIFENPQHPYTWALLQSVPSLENKNKEKLYSLGGTPPDLLEPPKGCSFSARCEYCMKICEKIKPPVTKISDTQSVSCWLKHSLAPKTEMPESLRRV